MTKPYAARFVWEAGDLELVGEEPLAEFNANHDKLGRFATKKGGGGAGYAASLAAIEADIRERNIGEAVVVVDSEGKVLLRKESDVDPDGPDGPAVAGVNFEGEEIGLLRGATVVHNHPPTDLGANSFSTADIQTAIVASPAEMRVVTKAGTTYSLKPKAGEQFDGAPVGNDFDGAKFSRVMLTQQAFSRENDRLLFDFMSGAVTQKQANWEMTHRAVESLSKTLGWTYTVTGPGAFGPET